MDLFRLKNEQSVNVIEMALPEDLDSADFDQLDQSLLGLLGTHDTRGWVIDLSAVEYMGSARLGLMVNFRPLPAEQNCAVQSSIERQFSILRVADNWRRTVPGEGRINAMETALRFQVRCVGMKRLMQDHGPVRQILI